MCDTILLISSFALFVHSLARKKSFFCKMAGSSKGQAVELATFRNYGKDSVIGSNTEDRNGKIMVTSVWCKLCAKHKDVILSNPLCKGNARKAIEAYIVGTNVVSKWNIDRHLQGKYKFSFF